MFDKSIIEAEKRDISELDLDWNFNKQIRDLKILLDRK